MTGKEKDLLLKDLCARLPYGVKAEKYTIRMDGEFTPLANVEIVTAKDIIVQDECSGYTIKPYLFPLSSMTEEQKEEHQNLIENHYSFDANGNVFTLQDFYCKYHFDYRGLIPMRLANNATSKNIY